MFHKHLDEGQAGDQLGALIRGIKRDEVKRGMVLCQPGTVTSHSKIKTQVINNNYFITIVITYDNKLIF